MENTMPKVVIDRHTPFTRAIIAHGTSFGSALAIAISFNVNHSVLWAIVHGIFSWFYVIYYILI
jgi:hypothetical protein